MPDEHALSTIQKTNPDGEPEGFILYNSNIMILFDGKSCIAQGKFYLDQLFL